MKKKYCIFSAQYHPHLGGIENYTSNVAKELIRRGHEVTVVTNNTTGSKNAEVMDGVRVLRFPSYDLINGRFPIMKPNRRFWKIHKYLEEQEFDFVMINARFYIHSIYAAIFAKRKGISCICLDHGTSHLSVHNEILDRIGAVYEHVHTMVLRLFCHRYYGVSEACCDWLAHFGIKADGVLYNAIDLDHIENLKAEATRDFREEYNIGRDDTVIAFTGRLLKEKGIYELIEAVEQYNKSGDKVYLMLAGDGDEMEYVKSHSSQYIIGLGRLAFPDVIALLKGSDIFCLPSFSEGFSTSALEAAVCECYIITTKRGGTKELVKDEEHGIVMETNATENILEALKRIVPDKELRNKGVELCYQRVKDHFTWVHTVDTLEDID